MRATSKVNLLGKGKTEAKTKAVTEVIEEKTMLMRA